MSRWDVLQKRGDWLEVWGITTKKVSPQLNLYFKTKYGDGVVYVTREIPGGVFVALAHMPEGAVEAAEARKERARMHRQENIARVNEERSIAVNESYKAKEPEPEPEPDEEEEDIGSEGIDGDD